MLVFPFPGKVQFTEEEISAMQTALDDHGQPLPQFKKIDGILADEMPVSEASAHNAIIAINEALEENDVGATLAALQGRRRGPDTFPELKHFSQATVLYVFFSPGISYSNMYTLVLKRG